MDNQQSNFRVVKAGALSLEVFNASEESFGVESVIISGEKDAVLVDAQFTLADAETVAQRILSSGKELKSIYISHNDPDFYFGLEVLKKYFPKVTAYATPTVVEKIKATSQKKLEVWGGRLGDKITSNIVLPQVLNGNQIDIEGHTLQVVGLEQFPEKTFLWIPDAKAIVGGINIFGDTFNLWMADAQSTESRQQWIDVLNKIVEYAPEIVIPAHAKNSDSFDIRSVQHTKEYIENYEQALKTAKTSEELIQSITSKYPNLTFDTALQLGAKVNTGEMKW
ncbi:MBL fold metallo-hydrolase [Chryseobacterium sp. Leaf405]|uniref:MBL fold metallo-hydrolase n=1 Tax=Chryseobacterium sp. Leaf405 TaxID=1736367 RepID=UPI0006F31DB8|nr:MBL fold metallo-hydrolase [Chryseobacterium sp. Leaf405]KQT22511.1 MBL fold metallo-hydrolase [Chryseobacterium sp. Leaf405]